MSLDLASLSREELEAHLLQMAMENTRLLNGMSRMINTVATLKEKERRRTETQSHLAGIVEKELASILKRDRLDTRNYLVEAWSISRKETLMIPQREHITALANEIRRINGTFR